MKHLPWILLGLVLAYPLFAQGTLTKLGTFNGPVKIWGQPAASDWVDITSGPEGGSPTQYVVPMGKVLTMTGIFKPGTAGGGVVIDVSIDGVLTVRRNPDPGRYMVIDSITVHGNGGGFIAREGQLVEVARVGGAEADPQVPGFLQGWLEDIR